jgi:hypothetical protein
MRALLSCILATGCLQPAGYFDDLRDAHADPDGDGWTAAQGDCGPHDPAVGPYMPETCDDKDNDCDGQIDEEPEDAEAWFDGDGDGFGDATAVIVTCTPPESFVAAGAPDCDDDDPLSFPGADERCDDADNDCDGLVDEDPAVDAPTWYLDVDADGYGSSVDAVTSCAPPSEEWVLNGDDCEPTNPDIHPGVVEVCNGEDDDCDGLADNPPISGDSLWYPDVDRDGYGDAAADGLCEPEPGFVSNNLDCGDRDAEVKPGAVEVCNDGVDNDCSGVAEGCEWPAVVNLDDGMRITQRTAGGDGFGSGVEVSDVDGDGVAELLIAEVGAPPVGAGPPGAFYVFDLPLDSTPTVEDAVAWRSSDDALQYVGQRLTSVDLDRDGFQDVLVTSLLGTGAGFGEGVLLVGMGPMPSVGASIDDHFTSRVHHDGEARELFGRSLAAVGDVTGDGLPEVAIGIERLGYPSQGGAAVVVGLPSTDASSVWDAAAFAAFGEGSDNLGWCICGTDINADGVSDLIVGAPFRSGTGQALVFYGPIGGEVGASDADAVISGRAANGQLGKGCSELLDGNGDGYGDFGLGASGDGSGWVGVFAEGLSSASVRADDATAQLLGTAEGSAGYFGASVHSAGDLNQDGSPDLMVGEVQWDPLAARVWFGPVVGTWSDLDADVTIWTPSEGGGYLREFHGGDDLTGDTVPDVLVSDEIRDEGRVWLVPGVGF